MPPRVADISHPMLRDVTDERQLAFTVVRITRHMTGIEETAYREAGHAVACVLLHSPFRYATVIPDTEAELLYRDFLCPVLPATAL